MLVGRDGIEPSCPVLQTGTHPSMSSSHSFGKECPAATRYSCPTKVRLTRREREMQLEVMQLLEPPTGFEPALSAWKAEVLPLHHGGTGPAPTASGAGKKKRLRRWARRWGQMRESNPRLGGYEPRDLTVCPICHLQSTYPQSKLLKSGCKERTPSRMFRFRGCFSRGVWRVNSPRKRCEHKI